MINTNNQPFTSKKIVAKQPETVYVLMVVADVIAVYRRKIDAQNDAIKYGISDYNIEETELT
jgi:hypothetical protein